MPDISMCQQTRCPHRGSCYRYLAWPSDYQSYYTGLEPETCDQFWPVDNRSVRTLAQADAAINRGCEVPE